MNQDNALHPAAQSMRVLYRALFAGQLVLAVTFALFVRFQGPLISDLPVLGHIIAAVAVGVLGVARFALRPRVPPRRSDERPNDYWATSETRAAVMLVWFMTEGAAILTFVAYLIAGGTYVALAAVAALFEFAGARPSHFEGTH
jgi:hypothetical protein